ncbi:MAG: tripartite tricarboxylate transporter substrate binding protein [Burkholderiales bacterium]
MSRGLVWAMAASMCVAGAAFAQNFPAKPIRLVTSSIGGGGDFAARVISNELGNRIGQRVLVDNRGGGVLAGEIVAKAPPDGYTLLLYGSTIWLAPFLQDKIGYNPERDFDPVTLPISAPNVLVVHPSLPAKSVQELIALARARPGVLNYASGATGSANHLGAELFKSMARVDIVQVNYKGTGAAMNDLIAGQVHLMFANAASVGPHVKSGRLRAIAVTTAKPTALASGLPTVAASGLLGFESSSVWGLFVPAGTPAAIIGQLNRDVVGVLNVAEVKQKLFSAGMETVGSTPEHLAAVVKSDMSRFGKMVKPGR